MPCNRRRNPIPFRNFYRLKILHCGQNHRDRRVLNPARDASETDRKNNTVSSRIIILLSALSILSGSCAFHSGVADGSVAITDGNFTVTENTYGFAKTVRFLGIGGFNHVALTHAARLDMQKRFPLEKGEAYANIITDYRWSFFPFVGITACHITAEKVRFEAPASPREAPRRKESESFKFETGDAVRTVDLKTGSSRKATIGNSDELTYLLMFEDLRRKRVRKTPNKGNIVVYDKRPEYYTGPLRVDGRVRKHSSSQEYIVIGFGEEFLLVTDMSGSIDLIRYQTIAEVLPPE